MLEINAISKVYHGPQGLIRALDNFTLTVQPGEFVTVKGPSGCGKTTLLLIGGGLLCPDEGSVLIDGNDPYGMHPDERAKFRASKIGFVFQQFYLVPYLSVLDNVLAPSLALPDPDAENRAHALIERFKLKTRRAHLPSELSTGERQRTGLARALLNNPKILLADEPTGNLDSGNAEIVMATFKDFTQSGGSVLMVSHDDHVGDYAERTINIEDGKLQNT